MPRTTGVLIHIHGSENDKNFWCKFGHTQIYINCFYEFFMPLPCSFTLRSFLRRPNKSKLTAPFVHYAMLALDETDRDPEASLRMLRRLFTIPFLSGPMRYRLSIFHRTSC
jgi:hypothetical protein